jgi:hypothetical protein
MRQAQFWASALALGGLAAGQAMAGDQAVALGRYTPPATGFIGGTSGASGVIGPEAAPDTELAHWYKRWGWGVPYYGFGYTTFYRPYWGGFYAGWGVPYYYGWGYSTFYRPYYWGGWGWGGGFYLINGAGVAVNTPNLQLNVAVGPRQPVAASPAATPTPPVRPAQPAPGTFPYDGGPANPVPQPAPNPPSEPLPAPAAEATAMRVGQSVSKPVYRYTAYGERR